MHDKDHEKLHKLAEDLDRVEGKVDELMEKIDHLIHIFTSHHQPGHHNHDDEENNE